MTQSAWQYQGSDFTSERLKESGAFAFVYLITDTENGRMYVGKKLCWKPAKRRIKIKTGPNAGKSRDQKYLVESDWETYYSSNRVISQNAIENPSRYKREILALCAGKGEAAYLEAKIQFERNVLLDPMYYNEIINLRINSKAIQNLKGSIHDKPRS